MKLKYTIVSILMLLTIAWGCTEKKNPIGYQIDPSNHLLSVDKEIVADSLKTASFFVEDYIRRSNSDIVVGKRNSLEVRSLLKISSFPGIPSDSVSIISAKLKMQVDEILNDESFYIEVRKITKAWTIGKVDWEQATDDISWDENGGDFGSTNLGSYQISEADSLVEIELSSSLIQYSVSDTSFFGLALIPFGNIENVVAFDWYTSSTAYPSLEISYIRTNEEEPDTTTVYYENLPSASIYNQTFEQPFVDTTAFVVSNMFPMKGMVSLPISRDIFVNTNGEPIQNQQYIIVNQAILELPVIEKEILHDFDVTAFTAYSAWDGSGTDYDLEDIVNYHKMISAETDTLRIDVTQTVQDWVIGLYENNGIVVHSWGEGATYGYIKCDSKGVLKMTYTFTQEEQ